MKETVAIIGIGKVGTSIGIALRKAGYRIVGLSSRKRNDSRLFSICDNFSKIPYEVTDSADIVFLTVTDDSVENVCKDIVDNGGFLDTSIVIHTSGALSSGVLASAVECSHLSIHPVKTFTSLIPVSLEDIFFSIEGDDIETGKRIVEDIRGIPFEIRKEDKLLYHAALTLSSSHFASLLGLSMSILKDIGLDEKLAYLMAEDTLKKVNKDGLRHSFSGPVRRKDLGVIESEIEALKGTSHIRVDTYKALTLLSAYMEIDLGLIDYEELNVLIKMLKKEKGN